MAKSRVSFSGFWRQLLLLLLITPLSVAQVDPVYEGLPAFDQAIQAAGGKLQVSERLSAYLDSVAAKIANASTDNDTVEVTLLNDRRIRLWSLPGGKVALSQGLFQEIESEAELAVLVAHALAHHSDAVVGASSGANYQALRNPAIAFPLRQTPSNYAFDSVDKTLGFIDVPQAPVREMVADLESQAMVLNAGYDPGVLAPLLVRLETKHSIDQPFFVAHPPNAARIHQARGNAARLLSRQADVNLAKRATPFLAMKDQLAKTIGESAVDVERALRAPNVKKALKILNKTIKAHDREPGLYNLRGELLQERGDHLQAVLAFQSALNIEQDHYGYHLNLGRSFLALQRFDDAKVHLEMSLALLPNALATYELGRLFEQTGQRDRAKSHYLRLMGESGSLGNVSEAAFIRLDLQDAPYLYFLAQTLVGYDEIVTTITNQSGLAVKGIEVRFRAHINGEPYETILMVGPLAKIDQVQLYPGWKITKDDEIEKVAVMVTRVVE
jgi:beta-barrel assembly-enhancing protease